MSTRLSHSRSAAASWASCAAVGGTTGRGRRLRSWCNAVVRRSQAKMSSWAASRARQAWSRLRVMSASMLRAQISTASRDGGGAGGATTGPVGLSVSRGRDEVAGTRATAARALSAAARTSASGTPGSASRNSRTIMSSGSSPMPGAGTGATGVGVERFPRITGAPAAGTVAAGGAADTTVSTPAGDWAGATEAVTPACTAGGTVTGCAGGGCAKGPPSLPPPPSPASATPVSPPASWPAAGRPTSLVG